MFVAAYVGSRIICQFSLLRRIEELVVAYSCRDRVCADFYNLAAPVAVCVNLCPFLFVRRLQQSYFRCTLFLLVSASSLSLRGAGVVSQEAEKALHYIETIGPAQLVSQLLIALACTSGFILSEAQTVRRELLGRCLSTPLLPRHHRWRRVSKSRGVLLAVFIEKSGDRCECPLFLRYFVFFASVVFVRRGEQFDPPQ